MPKHSNAQGLMQAVEIEITGPLMNNIWSEVELDHQSNKRTVPIPSTWVFNYEFDQNEYLVKYKACLYAENNLQNTDHDGFAFILVSQTIRVLIILVTTFDLKTNQYNAVNTFANSFIDKPTFENF